MVKEYTEFNYIYHYNNIIYRIYTGIIIFHNIAL